MEAYCPGPNQSGCITVGSPPHIVKGHKLMEIQTTAAVLAEFDQPHMHNVELFA